MMAPTAPGALVHPATTGDPWRRWVLTTTLAAGLAYIIGLTPANIHDLCVRHHPWREASG